MSTLSRGYLLPFDYIVAFHQNSLKEKYSTKINSENFNESKINTKLEDLKEQIKDEGAIRRDWMNI